jgi:hypothetical protein
MEFITGHFPTDPHVNARKSVAVGKHHAIKTQEGIGVKFGTKWKLSASRTGCFLPENDLPVRRG